MITEFLIFDNARTCRNKMIFVFITFRYFFCVCAVCRITKRYALSVNIIYRETSEKIDYFIEINNPSNEIVKNKTKYDKNENVIFFFVAFRRKECKTLN